MSYVITYFLGLYITTWECAGHVGRKQGIRGERRDRVETVKRKTPTRKTLFIYVGTMILSKQLARNEWKLLNTERDGKYYRRPTP